MADCLFCGIVAGDVPADVVQRGQHTVAFRDINPQAPTHVLVVPKDHVDDAAALDAGHGEMLAELFTTARTVAHADGVDASGFRLVFNVGEDARNTVGHLHLHVLGGRSLEWPPG
ncbi:MAG TPA: histidine triad nucleotide-binding protein [Acidimicrobiales bacterium]|jgi:histidine triad (HIT) family protein|nr:histidine triad nucleotide-binding protein [Acidimicrobiales bacterium]